MKLKSLALGTSLLLLAACGGSGDSNGSEEEVQLPDLTQYQMSTEPLTKATDDEFLTYLRNGIYLNSIDTRKYEESADDAASAPVAADGDYSQTTTQEVGVDEADRVKYDGQIIYLAANAYGNYVFAEGAERPATHVRVLQRQSDNSLVELTDIPINAEQSSSNSINGLYLNTETQQLAVLSNQYTYFGPIGMVVADIWMPYEESFDIAIYDVSSPDLPQSQASFHIDGHPLASRRIGDSLVVVSSFSPWRNELIAFADDEDEQKQNYELVQDLSEMELLPTYTDAQGESHPLVTADSCYLPEDASSEQGYSGIVTLTRISLSNPEQVESICVNAPIQGLYASPTSVYLYGGDYRSESFVHQFSLSEQSIDYSASGQLEGGLTGQNVSLRFSEYDGRLRVMTTLRTGDSEDRLDHILTVLEPDGEGAFDVVGRLPNELRPDEIGKPNEDLFAVRYFGEKAYLVTFERIDPLYVLDLANPNDPKIAGELEITGFSSYLQPITEELVFAIGQEVDPNRFLAEPAVVSADVVAPEPEEGVKVALFDVSDPANPLEVGKKIFGNGYSAAEYNYHALTYLPPTTGRTEHRIALPVQTWGSEQTGDNDYVWFERSELALFEIAPDATEPFVYKGSVSSDQELQNFYSSSWEDRAILHSDIIYYLHGNQIWQSEWHAPELVTGPY